MSRMALMGDEPVFGVLLVSICANMVVEQNWINCTLNNQGGNTQFKVLDALFTC